MNYFVGLDLGQAQDYTALSVLQAVGTEYHIRHLQRFRLGTSYPDVVAETGKMMATLQDAVLVVDNTGVGRPVVDLFRQAQLRPIAVSITGGDAATFDGGAWRVPKRDLVGALAVAFQSGTLKIAPDLPEAKTLIEELLNFKVKINLKTAHDSYEAWREGVHDDLVLSVALALWYAARPRPHIRVAAFKNGVQVGRGFSSS
jgi:phage terminase large subunit-like protein